MLGVLCVLCVLVVSEPANGMEAKLLRVWVLQGGGCCWVPVLLGGLPMPVMDEPPAKIFRMLKALCDQRREQRAVARTLQKKSSRPQTRKSPVSITQYVVLSNRC